MNTFLQSQFQTLFAYHWHTTERLLGGAAKLNDADYFADPGYGHGSIHMLLFHILRTDEAWRQAIETGQQQAGMASQDLPDLASLRDGFRQAQAHWNALLTRLSDQEIQSDAQLLNWRGEPWSLPLWRILQHVVLHGMQHHTEIAQLLTARGQAPGDIDFLFFR